MAETLTACPICQSANIKPRKPSNFPASICECGQVFLNPRMSDEETRLYYRGAYRDKVSGAGGILQGDLITQHTRARIQADVCAEHLRGVTACLEIGASAGYLLYELATRYHIQGIGVEPDERYHSLDPARKFVMYRDISEVEHAPIFDLFALSHSLEHLNHPLEYIRNLVENYGQPGAKFLIEVPNLAVYVNTLSVHHPFAFNQASLDALFHRIGYRRLMHYTHNLERNNNAMFLLAMYGVDDG